MFALLWLACVFAVQDGADAWLLDRQRDDDYDNNIDYRYDSEVVSSSKVTTRTQEMTLLTTRRDDGTTTPARTLNPNEQKEVMGILRKMMEDGDLAGVTASSGNDLRRLMDLFSTASPDLLTHLAQFSPRSYGNGSEETTPLAILRSNPVAVNFTYGKRIYHRYNRHRLIPTSGTSFMQHIKKITLESCLDICNNFKPAMCRAASYDAGWHECHISFYKRGEFGSYLAYNLYHIYFEYYMDVPTTTKEPTATTTPPPTTPELPLVNIRKLVEIIANLTMNTIESNITDLFNATLQKYGIPMCGETTTAEAPVYDFENASIVAKCFVCGLDTPGIPRNAFCADAFAGDFLPLVPVDPRARGQIATYRKYCRYVDAAGVLMNRTQPRSVFGRFTGGCSVRWIDLSGVYTQRTCRNRRHAVMGKHYVSKRMAKLEMALQNEDNGCIISPMSSLVPLSRGISLYARFHACVCTGSWCNSAPHAPPWRAGLAVITALAAVAAVAAAV